MSKFPDFWKSYPALSLLFDKKFVNDPKSSDLMHCIVLYNDPRSELSMETSDSLRLDYIKKEFPNFNPSDQFTISITERYMKFVPELEIAFNRLVRAINKNVEFIVNKEPADVKEAKIQMDVQIDNFSTIERAAKVRKQLTDARSVSEAEGVSGYMPSWVEQGLIGS